MKLINRTRLYQGTSLFLELYKFTVCVWQDCIIVMDWCDCLRPSLFGIYCLVKVILPPSHQCIMDIKGEKNYLIRKSIV